MRFYLDENLSTTTAEIARARGLDVVSSQERGQNGLPDELQLRLAAEEGRCFVTRDRDHFLALTARFLQAGWPHAGVLIVSRSLPSDHFAAIAAALLDYDRRYPEGMPAYMVDYLHPPAP